MNKPLNNPAAALGLGGVAPAVPRPGFQAAPQLQRPVMRKPVVVFCFPGRDFTPGFFDSWTTTILRLSNNQRPFDFMMSRAYSPVINHCRANVLGASNLAGRQQKPFQGQIQYDYLLWIDSDIVFGMEQIMAIFQKMHMNPDIKVLSGVYRTQDGVHSTVIRTWDKEAFLKTGIFPQMTPEELLEEGKKDKRGLVKIFGVGMGFMMIRRGVFEQIQYPWFGPVFHEIEHTYDFSSEDISFCHKLNDAGIPVYADPKIIVGHEKPVIIR